MLRLYIRKLEASLFSQFVDDRDGQFVILPCPCLRVFSYPNTLPVSNFPSCPISNEGECKDHSFPSYIPIFERLVGVFELVNQGHVRAIIRTKDSSP